jgi:hypothetical protein
VRLSRTTLQTGNINLAGKQLINNPNIPEKIALKLISKLEILENYFDNKLKRTISDGYFHGRDIPLLGSQKKSHL